MASNIRLCHYVAIYRKAAGMWFIKLILRFAVVYLPKREMTPTFAVVNSYSLISVTRMQNTYKKVEIVLDVMLYHCVDRSWHFKATVII